MMLMIFFNLKKNDQLNFEYMMTINKKSNIDWHPNKVKIS